MRPLPFESRHRPSGFCSQASPANSRFRKPLAVGLFVGFLVMCGLFSSASTAMAETVSLFGEAGLDGISGEPGLTGTNGGDGASVTATANLPFQDNTAVAVAGDGGSGGAGGAATAGSGGDGGAGGSGGNAGDAIAEAHTSGGNDVIAVATGGIGGAVGPGGAGSAPGTEGMPGQSAGAGSHATAIASIEASFGLLDLSGAMQGTAEATAGRATGAGEVGDARATIVGHATGVGDSTAAHSLSATANGVYPRGGSNVGDAAAEATGSTTHGTLEVTAAANSGITSPVLWSGVGSYLRGDATAIANGTHSGDGKLTVAAHASAGIGRVSPGGGSNQAQASGIASAGADVSVTATMVGGEKLELRDAVSGSTSGLLELHQFVGTQSGGSPPLFALYGTSGPTRTGLVAENTGGGDLDINLTAVGFRLDSSVPRDAEIDLGDVHGISNSGADVNVEANVTGFRISQVDLDDANKASQIFGTSNGGDVSVVADFVLHTPFSGIVAIDGGQLIGEDGVSLVMEDSVSGETTGNLNLIQRARASDGASIGSGVLPIPAPPFNISVPGVGGDVTNRLSKTGSFESLFLNGTSQAGEGGSTDFAGIGGQGGTSATILRGANDVGRVEIVGNSLGGDGGFGRDEGGQGGDAILDFSATTYGDGHDISIGNELDQVIDRSTRPSVRTVHGAQAGNGGALRSSSTTLNIRNDGGSAECQSGGLANGDSEVLVYDSARAGRAGSVNFPDPSDSYSGGNGGHATSRAVAEGHGTARVLAQSRALGGSGLIGTNLRDGFGLGGNAESYASSSGLGESHASAFSESGSGSAVSGQSSSAHSVAEVSGAFGTAIAEARSRSAHSRYFRTMLSRSTSTQTRLEATATSGVAVSEASSPAAFGGSAFLTGNPLAGDASDFVGRHAGLGALFDEVPGAHVEALGLWSAGGEQSGPTTQLVELDITLRTPESQNDLALAFSKLSQVGGGFESLTFRLEVLGEIFIENVVFDNLTEANAYFETVFMLGQAYSENMSFYLDPAVRVIFEVTTLPGQSVSFGLAAIVVPEPSTALLLGIGLVVFAGGRRRDDRWAGRH